MASILLDPSHAITKLLIKHDDDLLLHPGECVLGDSSRECWLRQGEDAIRKHQCQCQTCQKWRASPVIPKMADLPPA